MLPLCEQGAGQAVTDLATRGAWVGKNRFDRDTGLRADRSEFEEERGGQ